MTLNDILSRLEGVKGRDGKYMALCPNHGDKTPSLSVSLGDDNKILLKCFAGCSTEDIVWSMGLQMKDLFAEITPATAFPVYETQQRTQSTVKEAEYLYSGGALKKVKYRRGDGSKFCTWLHREGDRWEKGRNGIAPGLYQSHILDNEESLFLVEGEKDVDNLGAAGMVAVSLPDGAQSKWVEAYGKALAGKQIAILPDNDAPGRKYAEMCAGKLREIAASVWILDLRQAWPDIPEKGDISDLIQRFGCEVATQMIEEMIQNTPQWEPATEESGQIEDDSFLSLFKPLTEFEEEEATWLIPGWVPEGQITLIAADGGVGKTTLWCDIIAALSAGRQCILDPPDHTRKPMKIAFCTTEDSVKKKLRKKLREAGANMDNIITMDLSADKEGALDDFNFGSTKMDQFVRHFKPAACAFDPVQGFVPPKVNMGARNEMRHCMAPLIVLGEDVGTTFMVVCHTNKRKGAYGRDRIADSADLWDIARSVIMAGYTETQGIRYLSNEKNNYTQLQETILFSINSAGQIQREGTSWKRDKEYMFDATAAKATPKREDCKDFILSTLRASLNQCMSSDDLNKKAEEYGYAYGTVKRAREDLNKDGITENYYLGNKGKKGRVCFVRIKQENSQAFEELPYDEPVPFTEPSA